MGGAQPLAATLNGGVFLGVDIDQWRIEKRIKTGYLDVMTRNYEKAIKMILEAKEKGDSISVGLVGDIACLCQRRRGKPGF